MNHLLVIADTLQGRIRPVTRELTAAALMIRDHMPGGQNRPIRIIVPGTDPRDLCQTLSRQTGLDAMGVKIPGTGAITSDVLTACLARVAREFPPAVILAAQTARMRDVMPGLAVRLHGLFIPGVTHIRTRESRCEFLRPVLGNTRLLPVLPVFDRPVVATLAPGAVPPASPSGRDTGRVDILEMAVACTGSIRHCGTSRRDGSSDNLKQARVIVAAGRGIGRPENLEWVERFARCFHHSAVGASRPLVDMGWIGYGHQVGITGAVVAPELYIACGISGSSQHLAGIREAGVVVSINTNPNAPIRRHSDLCITADAVAFIQTFLEQHKIKGENRGFSGIR